MRVKQRRTPKSLLPLPDGVFYILLSLIEGERHGYAIMKHVRSVTEGEVLMGTGTLYRSLQTMRQAGLVESLGASPESGNTDERRCYYRLTSTGQRIMLVDFEQREAKYQRERRWIGFD